jgi:hypothetical protein
MVPAGKPAADRNFPSDPAVFPDLCSGIFENPANSYYFYTLTFPQERTSNKSALTYRIAENFILKRGYLEKQPGFHI